MDLCRDSLLIYTKFLPFGVSLDLLLFGVLTVQTYVYYLAFPKDRRLLKMAVTWVYLVGVAQTILAMVDLLRGGFPPKLDGNGCFDYDFEPHFALTVIVSSAAVALVAQWLYAYRIYVLSHKLWILILIICLSLGQLGTSIIGSMCLWYNGYTVAGIEGGICATGFGWVWGPLNFLCDATITVSMSVLLLKGRKGTLKKTTYAHITRIIRLVVETGLVTSVVVVVYTLTYNLSALLGIQLYNFWLLPGLAMGKVYSNSMLALLNSRLTIVGGRNTGDPFGISEIRSELLYTEDRATSTVIRRRTLNADSLGST